MRFIEDFLGVPIVLMSTGPGREETLSFRIRLRQSEQPGTLWSDSSVARTTWEGLGSGPCLRRLIAF